MWEDHVLITAIRLSVKFFLFWNFGLVSALVPYRDHLIVEGTWLRLCVSANQTEQVIPSPCKAQFLPLQNLTQIAGPILDLAD